MRVLLFGATGMIGQGVLRECLLDKSVEKVVTIGRTASGQCDPKLEDMVRDDLSSLSVNEVALTGFDACFFCLGVSSAGMSEENYRRITYQITMAAARVLASLNPQMTFVYVSGSGADDTGKSKIMWARVKGQTERDLRALPFKAVYIFRPGLIQPLHGIKSRTRIYNLIYAISAPLFPLLKALMPASVSNTEQLGHAMIQVAKSGYSKAVLENRDINSL